VQIRRILTAAAAAVAVIALLGVASAAADPPPWAHKADDSGSAVNHDVSPPLRDIAPAPPPPTDKKKEKEPQKGPTVRNQRTPGDPVVQA
jgi:hypothetical protein